MNAFSAWWDSITGRTALLATIKSQADELKANATELQADASIIEQMKKTILSLQGQIPVLDPLETYWNTKRPATNTYQYSARTTINGSYNIRMDPRFFFENQDNGLPLQTGANHDEIALKSLYWVIQNITYTSDLSQFKNPEEWLFPAETLFLRKGDCEDGAILMVNMMIKAGIPYWRIRLNAGDVWDGNGTPMSGGKIGHCWVTYLQEKDNVWYIYDWCYNAGIHKWKDAEDYFDIWFSWNRDYIFAQDALDKP